MDFRNEIIRNDTGILTEDEYKIIVGNSENAIEKMLNDQHMYKFSEIIRENTQFRIQSTLYIQSPEFIVPIPINEEYIQIMYSGNSELGHWTC